jgi:hypothetical protein
MKKRSKLCLILMLLTLSFANCRKKVTYFGIADKRLEDAVTYRSGSYFVFVDSATHVEDSFSYAAYFTNPSPVFDNDGNLIEEWVNIDCSIGDNPAPGSRETHALIFTCGGSPIYSRRANVEYRTYADGAGHSQGSGFFLKFPFEVGDTSGSYLPSFSSVSVGHYDHYPVGGKIYNDVYETYNTGMHTFYSTESGLVKFSLVDTSGAPRTWYLSRSRIVR